MEGELFGHKRGAFTGATADREGCFEAARGGTLFLDEIGEMPVTSQVKLLRVLQEGQVTRLGESHPRDVDVRIIAATNQRLQDLVASGTFRQDLFYRLHVVGLTIPPLRERSEDIPDLVTHFIEQLNRRYNRHIKGCDPQTMQSLLGHPWPGNVRELEHAIEHAFVVSAPDQKALSVDLLPAEVGSGISLSGTPVVAPVREQDESAAVKAALEQAHGNKAAAARLLGITRTGLYKKIRRLGL